jgi:hypothetical protein
MTDTEKERELPEEGMDMNNQNLFELGEKKESSLAADQESVTGNQNLNNSINGSSIEEDGSTLENEPHKTSINEVPGDSPAPKIPDKEKEPKKEDPSTFPEVKGKGDNEKGDSAQAQAEETLLPAKEKDPESKTAPPETEENESKEIEKEPEAAQKESEVVEIEPEAVTEQPDIKSQTPATNSADEVNKEETATKSDKSDQDKGKPTKDLIVSAGKDAADITGSEKISDAAGQDTAADEVVKEEIHLEEEIEEEKDYSLLKKDELINEFEALLKIDDIKLTEKKIKELKPFYQEIVESEKKIALQKFLDDGGAEIDFKYVGDALDSRYANLNDKYKGRRNAYYSELEKNKEDNLARKQEILEKLRAIVDGEETNASISALKNITKEWRSFGPVPSAYAKSMWATYNILIDRFYDNRSIYFELKELDRKKNLESKLELCEKAEHLLEYEVIRDAVKELNELHEEFKHIGPVPKEMQEVVWQRFKSASDAIYNRRKDYVSGLKKELHENLESKKQLVDEVAKFNEFDSDKISDWNEKTKEILDLQKKWESIGGLPREHAKEINKHFWSSFKSFFNNKNKFFKKLESQRDDNLLKKEDLVKRAEELQESSDWEKTAEELKELQREWKDIGPVPEKHRNEVYKKFKKACDAFFNKRREHSKEVESEYKINLRKKEEICAEIEKMVEEKDKNIDRFKELQVMFNGIGFVPRNTIKRIQKKFSHASELFLNSFDLSDTEKSELRFAAEVDKLKASPNADRRIHRKEVEVKRLISKIENDIALWKNNIEFFAKSKTADKVREEFNEKIAKATAQLEELREELKVLNKI